MSDFIDLSSPYGSSSFGFGNRPHTRQSIKSIGSLHRKSASAQYNPILTPQEEYSNRSFQSQNGQQKPEPSTMLGSNRVGKFGTDLIIEILLCSFTLLVSVPFMWLAITMSKYDGQRVTADDSNYIKQATSTVRTMSRKLWSYADENRRLLSSPSSSQLCWARLSSVSQHSDWKRASRSVFSSSLCKAARFSPR